MFLTTQLAHSGQQRQQTSTEKRPGCPFPRLELGWRGLCSSSVPSFSEPLTVRLPALPCRAALGAFAPGGVRPTHELTLLITFHVPRAASDVRGLGLLAGDCTRRDCRPSGAAPEPGKGARPVSLFSHSAPVPTLGFPLPVYLSTPAALDRPGGGHLTGLKYRGCCRKRATSRPCRHHIF